MRRATAADIPEITRVTNLAYAAEAFFLRGDRTSPEEVGQLMETGFFLVVPGGDGRLEASVFLRPEGLRWYLGLLAVAPECQQRGLGRGMVEAAAALCREEGGKFLDLTVVNVRRELFGFYGALDFHANDVQPLRNPERAILPCHLVRLTRSLSPAWEL